MACKDRDMSTLWRIMVREWRRIVAQPLCWGCMIGAPLFGILFFVTLLNEGLPEHIPTAVVDLDNSALSRSFVRQLQAQQAIDIALQCDTYIDAVQAMQRNEVYGFVLIPSRFEELLFDGKQPPLSFYTNDAYLIPGSLLYECYTTQSMLISAAVIQDLLLSLGFSPQRIMSLLQPIAIDSHALGNPWVNYSIYLSNSFLPAMLQLMVLLVTMYAVASEFKKGSVRSWLLAARGSFLMALAGKLLVYTLVFFVEGVLLQSMLYGYLHFPLHTSIWRMMCAMFLLVVASQSIVLIVLSLVSSHSIAFSAVSVLGVVSFSLGGFSFPVPDMYAPFKVLTNLLPVRHYFLIYVNNALNGYPLYYCRDAYMALLLFVVIALLMLPRMYRAVVCYERNENVETFKS